MNEIAYPDQTTYVMVRDGGGNVFAVEVEPTMCLHLGAGATILWQGTDPEVWAAEKTRAGITEE
jgi:hypothetical protein